MLEYSIYIGFSWSAVFLTMYEKNICFFSYEIVHYVHYQVNNPTSEVRLLDYVLNMLDKAKSLCFISGNFYQIQDKYPQITMKQS